MGDAAMMNPGAPDMQPRSRPVCVALEAAAAAAAARARHEGPSGPENTCHGSKPPCKPKSPWCVCKKRTDAWSAVHLRRVPHLPRLVCLWE